MTAKPPSATTGRAAAPSRLEEYSLLAQFTLSLIKAVLEAGYYAPDHPEAKKALRNLYAEFRQVITDRSELTYLAGAIGGGRTILIEGYEPTPLGLDAVMMKGMAELFTPKFLEFFDRRSLLSFSLKADITTEEFQAFVELMAQPPGLGQGTASEHERLTQAFLDHHILHISTVFNDDLVGRERRLPWRVEMALSRLRRDLRLLPLYQHASAEEIRRIKVQIIDDVVRPIRTPGLLKDFLVNCDLVAQDIAVLDATQVERETVARLSQEMLGPTARELVQDLERLGTSQTGTAEGPSRGLSRRLAILREVVGRLRGEASALDDDLLDSLLRRQLLSLDDLPPDLQRAMEARRLVGEFLARKDEHLQALGRMAENEAGSGLAAMVDRILPELLRRGECRTVAAILRAVEERRQGSPPCQLLEGLASSMREAMTTPDAMARLLEDLRRQDKDGRNHLVEILAFTGGPAGPGLLEVYASSDSRSVRASAFEAMRRIGASALGPFLGRLGEIEREWLAMHHILVAVGELGDPSLAQPLGGFLHHDNPHIRQANLTALVKLVGAGAESHFLRALRDREAAVRQVAVDCLGRIRSRHREALEFYARVLRADDPSAPREDDAVLVQVCRALAGFETLPAEDIRRAEAIFLAALKPPEQKGLLGRLKKGAHRHSEAVRIAVLEALALVGTPGAVGLLQQVADTEGPPVADKARAAARRIQERASRSPSG